MIAVSSLMRKPGLRQPFRMLFAYMEVTWAVELPQGSTGAGTPARDPHPPRDLLLAPEASRPRRSPKTMGEKNKSMQPPAAADFGWRVMPEGGWPAGERLHTAPELLACRRFCRRCCRRCCQCCSSCSGCSCYGTLPLRRRRRPVMGPKGPRGQRAQRRRWRLRWQRRST